MSFECFECCADLNYIFVFNVDKVNVQLVFVKLKNKNLQKNIFVLV